MIAVALGDWADAAALVGTALSLVGLALVWVQLRAGAAAARAQATIQFQQAFRESRESRNRVLKSFPIHERMLFELTGRRTVPGFPTWSDENDLTIEQRRDATTVINALNDVAQYVADGLSLRSALQQYHQTFIRAGMLLGPLIDQRNSEASMRNGVRVIELYNAGLAYHRTNPKHRGRALALTRSGDRRIVLIDARSDGLQPNTRYDAPAPRWELGVPGPPSMSRAVRRAERNLRR